MPWAPKPMPWLTRTGRKNAPNSGAVSLPRPWMTPWVPIFNEQRVTVHSKRMGGDDALYVDGHVPVNYDYIWVK